jgi:hypothetical protein
MAVKIQFRRDTAANWELNNPVLAVGELGLDLTNKNIKIGDGTTAWNTLVYIREPTADFITYNNENSGLDAENVQDAIDELKTLIINQDEAKELGYDNTDSGLVANTIQDAIDEVASGTIDLSAISQNIIPATNITYDLGSTDYRWRDLYLNGGTIYLGDIVIKDNGNNTLGIYQADGETPVQISGIEANSILYDNTTSGLTATTIQAAVTELDGLIDTINGADTIEGSIAKAKKDAIDYADSIADAQNEADEIAYDQTGQTYALGANVQAAVYAIDDELIVQDNRLDVIEGNSSTAGSIAKALSDANSYTDTREIAITSAYESYANQAEADAITTANNYTDQRETAITLAYEDAIDIAKLALGTNFSVANLTERSNLEDLTVGDIVFVADDGDSKWAQYKVTAVTDGLGSTSTFVKIMDEDVYLNAISAEAVLNTIKTVDGTGSGLDADLLDGQEGSYYKTSSNINYDNTVSGISATNVKSAIDEVEGRLDTVENTLSNLSADAIDITYDNTNSELTSTNVQGAIDGLDLLVNNIIGGTQSITYDNSETSLNADTLQKAIDQIYLMIVGNLTTTDGGTPDSGDNDYTNTINGGTPSGEFSYSVDGGHP